MAGNLKEAILAVVLAVVTIASAASSIVVGKEYNVSDGEAAYRTVRKPSDEDTTGAADDKREGRL